MPVQRQAGRYLTSSTGAQETGGCVSSTAAPCAPHTSAAHQRAVARERSPLACELRGIERALCPPSTAGASHLPGAGRTACWLSAATRLRWGARGRVRRGVGRPASKNGAARPARARQSGARATVLHARARRDAPAQQPGAAPGRCARCLHGASRRAVCKSREQESRRPKGGSRVVEGPDPESVLRSVTVPTRQTAARELQENPCTCRVTSLVTCCGRACCSGVAHTAPTTQRTRRENRQPLRLLSQRRARRGDTQQPGVQKQRCQATTPSHERRRGVTTAKPAAPLPTAPLAGGVPCASLGGALR